MTSCVPFQLGLSTTSRAYHPCRPFFLFSSPFGLERLIYSFKFVHFLVIIINRYCFTAKKKRKVNKTLIILLNKLNMNRSKILHVWIENYLYICHCNNLWVWWIMQGVCLYISLISYFYMEMHD